MEKLTKVFCRAVLVYVVFNAVSIAKEIDKESEIYKFGLVVGECFKAYYDDNIFAPTRDEANKYIINCINIVATEGYQEEVEIL